MKKLSFIMAVLMILMCMPIMAISAAEEVVAPDANAPESVTMTNTWEQHGENYKLYQYASDEEAIADGAIGRFTKEGGNGYAKTWFAVGSEATASGATVFYMLKDYVWSDSGKRIGSELGLDMGAAGRKVIVDGSLGQLTSAKTNFKIENTAGRVLHYNSNPKGAVTFRNVKLVSGGTTGMIQANAGSTPLTFENCEIIATQADYVFVNGGIITIKGDTTITNKKAGKYAFYCHAAGSVTNIEGGTITASYGWRAVAKNCVLNYSNASMYCDTRGIYVESDITGIVANVYSGNITNTYAGRAPIQINQGQVKMNIYGGNFTGGFGLVLNTNCSVGTEINVYGGTFVADVDDCIRNQCKNSPTINIYGGTWIGKKHAIYVTGDGSGTLNIYDGVFSSDSARIIRSTGLDKEGSSNINVYDGTFVAKNFDKNLDDFSTTPTPTAGVLFVERYSKINVYGGTFTAYKDSGITLANETAFVYAWKSAEKYTASVSVLGGSFNGGKCFVADVLYSGDKNDPIDMENATFYYYTEGTNSVALAPKATQGASVRLDKDSSGLRFTATIDALALTFIKENLMKEGTEFTFGTMIVPSNYVKYAGGELTMAAFDKAGKAYLNIEAKDGIIVNEDGSVTINAAMTNIKKENYDRDFIAVAYIKYTDKTGAEVIKYATNVNLAAFSRNVQEVAFAALADVLTTSAGTYVNKVDSYYVWNQNARKYELTPGTAYSRYNAEQVAVLKSYILPTDAE